MVTAKGKTRLRKAIRSTRHPIIARGNDILTLWLEQNAIPDNNQVITKLQGIFHVENRDELCYQLGAEEIVLADYLVPQLRKHISKQGRATRFIKKWLPFTKAEDKAVSGAENASEDAGDKVSAVNTKNVYRLEIDGDKANFRFASCCSPIPGDDVMGFVADDGIVEVHSLNCPRAQILKAGYGSRIVATEWAAGSSRFLAHIRIEGIDRRGILQQITLLISNQLGIDMRKLNIEASDEVFRCDLWVRVSDTEAVADLCARTRGIEGVTSATRIN